MKFIINDAEYTFDGVDRFSLWELLEMKKHTGMGVREFQQLGELVQRQVEERKASGVTEEFFSDDMLELLSRMIWLSRYKAGERLTLEQATSFDLADLQVITDDEPVESDPNQ